MKAGRVSPFLAVVALLLPGGSALQHAAAGNVTRLPQQGAQVAALSAPVWAKPGHFWFRKTVPGGNIWITVDAEHGVKEPLFDHQRLAIEMTLRTGVEYTPLTLPFADPAMRFVVKYDGSNAYIQEGAMAIEFIHGDNHWRCDLQIKWDWNRVPPTDYECLSRRPVLPGAPAPAEAQAENTPVLSPDGRMQAFIQNNNVVVRAAGSPDAKVTALSADGSANAAYQRGSIKWSADSRSLSAYRVNAQVWMSEGVTGNVKGLMVRGEWKVAGPWPSAFSPHPSSLIPRSL